MTENFNSNQFFDGTILLTHCQKEKEFTFLLNEILICTFARKKKVVVVTVKVCVYNPDHASRSEARFAVQKWAYN